MLKLSKIRNKTVLTAAYLATLVGLFFLGTSAYQYCLQRSNLVKWSSPDEAANYYFSRQLAETGQPLGSNGLTSFESVIVHPRSIKSSFGVLQPVSFLGLPLLYGIIGQLVSIKVLSYLTPLLGALGLWLFFSLISQWFNRSTALVATTVLFTFPIYWYFSSKSMFHNILFVVMGLFSLFGGWQALSRLKNREIKPLVDWRALLWLAVSGMAFGWMVATRTSELLWLAPLVLLLFIFYFKEIGWYRWAWWGAFAWLAVLPVAFWNQVLHGGWYAGGYPAMNQSLNQLGQTSLSLFGSVGSGSLSVLIDKLKSLGQTVFYFGFWPKQSWFVFKQYVIKMFPWLWPLTMLGIVVFVFSKKRWSKEKWLLLWSWILSSVFLVLYYGSWQFHDNPDPSRFTIGNSYTRYWLPIYLGALPWLAEGLRWLTKFLFRRPIVRPVIISFLVVISVWSLRFTLFGSEEGLVYAGQRQINDYQLWSEIINRTEDDSIIITNYHDKLFFPERQIIVGLFDDNTMNQYYSRLLRERPIYYFNFSLPENDIKYLNNRRLLPFGYVLEWQWSYGDFSLYRLQVRDSLENEEGEYE